MPSNPLLENNVQELLYVETYAEYSAGSGIDITNKVISVDPNLSAAIDNKLDTSSFSSYSATIDDELQYVSANAGKTYSGIAPIVVNNDTNEISANTQDISFGVGLDFKNSVLSVTAQGGDPEVETVVKTNSADWGTITAFSSTSSVLNNQVTALRHDLITVITNTGYLYNDLQTTSGILSAAIDYVSANAGDEFPASANEAITAYQTYSGTYLTAHQDISNKLDTTAFSTVSGSFLTAVDLTPYYTTADANTVSSMFSGAIDYVSANAITSLDGYATTSEVNTVSSYLSGQIDNKLDSTSFNPNDYYPMVGNPSGFISGVDLTDYQTKAGMTAYQPAGDYATTGDLYNTSSTLSGAIDYISGNAGTTYTGVAPIVVTGNTISADSFDLNIGSGLAFENNTLYVSAESVPEGVMVESACEYNAVNEISAYNGSAIAQYGAEKQWLVHDDTIVSISNSAQYAFGCNISALQRLMGIDETVLWSGNAGYGEMPITLSESMDNFENIEFTWIPRYNGDYGSPTRVDKLSTNSYNGKLQWTLGGFYRNAGSNWIGYVYLSANNTSTVLTHASSFYINPTTTAAPGTNLAFRVCKVVGIGRKA